MNDAVYNVSYIGLYKIDAKGPLNDALYECSNTVVYKIDYMSPLNDAAHALFIHWAI